MSAPPAIDVVICTYDRRRLDLLAGALDACTGQLAAHDQLVVVVDGGADLARDVGHVLGERGTLVAAGPGRGLSAARNRGVAAGANPLVAFLDDDAVPRPGWLDALRGAFADPATVMVGGAVHARWEGTGIAPRWFPHEFGWVVGCDYDGMPGDGPVRNPIGANMAVRRSVLEGGKAFDPGLGRRGAGTAGCEETDLALRLRARCPEARIVRASAAAVDHRVPVDRQSIGHLLRRCYGEGRSKALLVRRRGRGALASEARHAGSTLPRSWAAALRAPRGEQPWALARAAVGAGGLAAASFGFAAGLVPARPPARGAS